MAVREAARGGDGGKHVLYGSRRVVATVERRARRGIGSAGGSCVVIVRETVHTTQPGADSNGNTTLPGWLNG